MGRTSLVVIPLLVSVLAGAGGCRGRPGELKAGGGARPTTQGAPDWPYWPAVLRVHPLTRIVTDPQTAEPLIEARIEFTDAEGVTSRAAGLLSVELWPAEPGASPDALNRWTADLADPLINRERFDIVTRTYLLRLKTDPGALEDRVALSVRFESADGQVLTARLMLDE
jgi:hypothetical protein